MELSESVQPVFHDPHSDCALCASDAEMAAIPLYSKSQVVEAGKLLATVIHDHNAPGVLDAFRIAHNWRDARFAR